MHFSMGDFSLKNFSCCRLVCALVLLTSSLLLAGNAKKMVVAVSLQPYANIVKEIGGDRVDVVSMLPPGADPHTYEPKPAVLKEFSRASVYFSDYSGMDKAWLPRFMGVNKNVAVKSISKNVQWLKEEEHEHHGEHEHREEHEHHGEHGHEHHHGDLDPHIWTSPAQVKNIAASIENSLCEMDAAGCAYYEKNWEKLDARVSLLSQKLEATLAKLPQEARTFIVFHPAYGYFARDYGMHQLTVEVEGKEPKPKDLQRLISEGREHHVKIVFVQPQFSKRAAGVIAKELNAVIVETDPLSADYLGNIEKLIDAIVRSGKK